jgi:hypothetical protein
MATPPTEAQKIVEKSQISIKHWENPKHALGGRAKGHKGPGRYK